jgi:hypothetical protein
VIVFSAVRCHNQLGFVSDEKRLNVMLTRAKRGLIVIGDENTLKTDHGNQITDEEIISQLGRNGSSTLTNKR